ncbi:hypothetical protein ACE1B6_20370 [Aerosakkonemataceae cyanobacterium BLCC-F154]|uniref:Uncharacterized protein n=1 Tax=Floridaenema fluviatile BLCC-F154 TaxID=3153640 RepID=A0ABV4YFK5_9CYAN
MLKNTGIQNKQVLLTSAGTAVGVAIEREIIKNILRKLEAG